MLSALSLPMGGIGGGGGGSGLPSQSASSSIGPANVNPSARSGEGDRGTFSNVVNFPGVRSEGWAINEPLGSLPGLSIKTVLLIALLATSVLLAIKISTR